MRALIVHARAGDVLPVLHPRTKRQVRAAIDALRADPMLGRELGRELRGLWRYQVGRLRVIYRFDDSRLEVVFVGPRSSIYEDLAVLVRTRQLSEQRRRYAAAGG